MAQRLTVVALGLLHAAAGDVPAMPNIGYLLKGYDIMFGNPIVDSKLLVDPGFREVVFDTVYDGDSLTSDNRYLQPKGTSVVTCAGSCTMDYTSTEIMGASSYQNTLSEKVTVTAEGYESSRPRQSTRQWRMERPLTMTCTITVRRTAVRTPLTR